jgi:hypothetical protein
MKNQDNRILFSNQYRASIPFGRHLNLIKKSDRASLGLPPAHVAVFPVNALIAKVNSVFI